MALKRQTHNNLAAGEALTAANSANSGDAITLPATAGTPTGVGTSTAEAIRGQRSVRVIGAVNDTLTYQLSNTADNAGTGQVYFTVDSTNAPVAASAVIGRIRSTSNMAIMVLSVTNVFSIQNAAGGGLKNFNGNAALPNGDYWADLQVVKGTTTTDGYIGCYLYNAATGALVDSYTSSTTNTGTGSPQYFQYGKPVAQGSMNIVFDEVAFITGSTLQAQITPVPQNVAPTASMVCNKTNIDIDEIATFEVTAADSDGTIASIVWSVATNTSGGNPKLTVVSGTNSTIATVTGPTTVDGGAIQVQAVVTDNRGATVTASASVSVYRAPVSYMISGVLTPSRRAYFQST